MKKRIYLVLSLAFFSLFFIASANAITTQYNQSQTANIAIYNETWSVQGVVLTQ
jgi:hypothetical protein